MSRAIATRGELNTIDDDRSLEKFAAECQDKNIIRGSMNGVMKDLHAFLNPSLIQSHSYSNIGIHSTELYVAPVPKLFDGFIGEHKMTLG